MTTPAVPLSAETIDFPDGTEVTRTDVREYLKTAHVRAGQATRGGIIPTLEGDLHFEAGDYIAGPGAGGEFWPVRRDIFESTYVRAEHTADAGDGLRDALASGNYLQVYDHRQNRWLSPDEAVAALRATGVPSDSELDHIAWAQHVRSEHEATHGEAEMCGPDCIRFGLATFDDEDAAS